MVIEIVTNWGYMEEWAEEVEMRMSEESGRESE